MTRKDELLAAYDSTLNHEWESLESVLKNIAEEEANFQHSSYSGDVQEPGDPPPGTVMWYLLHLPHCYRHYVNVITQRPARPADPPPPQAANVSEAIELLQQERNRLRATIVALLEEELDESVWSGRTVADFIRASIRHDAWHAGQIAIARRLWRTRELGR